MVTRRLLKMESNCIVKPNEEKIFLKHKIQIRWARLTFFLVLHLMFLYAMLFIFQVKKETFQFSSLLVFLSCLGTTAGTHRLWSHRAYKARLPLRLVLLVWQTLSFQLSVIDWCRDHRLHHKCSDTDADPHNSNRGFFFSHIGWLVCTRLEEVRRNRKKVDTSDLEADPLLRFQKRYYFRLVFIFSIGLPIIIPVVFFHESFFLSFLFAFVCRLTLAYHFTFLVNSAAHLWGNRPYDINIKPRQNLLVSWIALGEGYHNYHHTFPWDYSTSELGSRVNATTAFINMMAFLGQAYDLKKANQKMIENRCQRTGENLPFVNF